MELEKKLRSIPDAYSLDESEDEVVVFDKPIEIKPLEPLKPLPSPILPPLVPVKSPKNRKNHRESTMRKEAKKL